MWLILPRKALEGFTEEVTLAQGLEGYQGSAIEENFKRLDCFQRGSKDICYYLLFSRVRRALYKE